MPSRRASARPRGPGAASTARPKTARSGVRRCLSACVRTRRRKRGGTLARWRAVHIHDVLGDPEYNPPEGALQRAQKLGQYRTTLVVPMLREGQPLGTITLWKTTVQPFTDKQIELVSTFADQAVIAIENVRLFEEVQARTQELTEFKSAQTFYG